MRLKLDSVTHARSSTQDGVRTKFALRFQLLDPADHEAAFALVGKTLDAQFESEQEALPGMEMEELEAEAPAPNGHVAEEEVVVPSNGRRRHGTRSSEQV